MKVSMPSGSAHGWGIAGEYLTREIAKLPPVEGVTLHCIGGVELTPLLPDVWDRINIGYTFFEEDIELLRHTRRAAAEWDHIVAGSSWCEQHLRIGGIRNTSTILQGIDPLIFSPSPPRCDDGRFIVFSGGKFENRKGQDIVIAALKILMARYPHIWLSCAWYNHWAFSMATMQYSPHITYHHREEECMTVLRSTLQDNGIPLERVILNPLMNNAQMAAVYQDTDIGLFPNRCEGGNNMVMSEYMACGRTVVASDATGQGDVITAANSFPLTRYEPLLINRNGKPSALWFEPSVDEVVEKLEYAYLNRDQIQGKSLCAGEDMLALRWQKAAHQFHSLACRLAGAANQNSIILSPVNREITAGDYFQEGLALLDGGQPALAEARFHKARLLNPFSAEIYNCLGGALDAQGKYLDALGYYNKALSLCSGSAVINFNIGNALKRLDRAAEAAECYREALTINPEFTEAYYNLGLVLQGQKLLGEAEEAYGKALALRPEHAATHHNLGDVLQEQGELERAISCYDKAIALDPQAAISWNSLANTLLSQGRYDEAIASYHKSLEIEPDNLMTLNNLGVAFKEQGDLDQAISCHRRVLTFDPEYADAHWNLALACLMKGDMDTGWQGYDWRWKKGTPVPRRDLLLPLWDGAALKGRKIILTTEQGAGDTLQFVRYAALVADRGGTVTVECQLASLKPIIKTVPGVARVSVVGEEVADADVHFPLMSLPGLFRTTLATIPAAVPYLGIDPSRNEHFRQELAAIQEYKVGIVWAGRQNLVRNRKRTCGLEAFSPLTKISEIKLFSLQVGPDAGQAAPWVAQGKLIDLTTLIHDFADTAALIANLDLVITIDTSVAHLAGAMGKPVWTLLHFAPDWRWMLGRNDSPWYPSMRLFRQHQPGDWQGVMTAVKESLKELLL